MRQHRVVSTLADEINSWSRPLYRNGARLSSRDAGSVKEVVSQWVLLLDDLCVLSLECEKRVVRHIWSDIFTSDIMEPLNAFSDALSCLLRQGHGFKAHVQQISPHLWRYLRPVWENHLLGQIDSTRILIQVFSFPTRLSLNDIDLTEESILDYRATESNITGQEVKNSYVLHLNQIIKRWVDPMDLTSMHFQHGPGSVAGHGRVPISVKDSDLTHDHLIRYAFNGPHRLSMRSVLDRYSQTIFVAKNYKSFRTISMESPTLMYYQQGVWGAIRDHVQGTRYLRNRIGFLDQTRNRLLAQEGSIVRNYATIDLSAASDSVSWELVKAVFKNTPLYRFLLATRSRDTVLPDGTTLHMKKFAPMGSALCFPIETLVFASVCEFVTREHGVAGDFSVYGDDIIVPSHCVSDVILVLTQLGFSVNDSKSFTDPDSPFRESCGGEFWNGVEVTPFRIARNYTSGVTLEQYQSLVDGANECYKRNFPLLRQFYLQQLSKFSEGTDFVPYFDETALESGSSTNYHTDRRWNPNLQRYEARVSVLKPTKATNKGCESARYNHWLRSTHRRNKVIEPFVSDISKSSVYVAREWKRTSVSSEFTLSYPPELALEIAKSKIKYK